MLWWPSWLLMNGPWNPEPLLTGQCFPLWGVFWCGIWAHYSDPWALGRNRRVCGTLQSRFFWLRQVYCNVLGCWWQFCEIELSRLGTLLLTNTQISDCLPCAIVILMQSVSQALISTTPQQSRCKIHAENQGHRSNGSNRTNVLSPCDTVSNKAVLMFGP